MRFLIIVLIISMMLIPAQNAFALPAKMDCTSILDEWSRVNYPSGNFVHDIIPPVTIDGKNTSFFIKAEQSTKNDDHIQLEMKLLDRNDHIMENSKFFVELLQDAKIIHRDLFYTSSGILVLDFDQNNSTKETTIDAEQANMGYFSSSSDNITIRSPTLDGTYQLKVTAVGACDKMVFFVPQEAVPVFQGSISVLDGHVNAVTVLKGDNSEKTASPLKQFKSGIPAKYVNCKEGYQLIIKSSTGTPACLDWENGKKLLWQGWAKSVPMISNSVCDLNCKIKLESQDYTCYEAAKNRHFCTNKISQRISDVVIPFSASSPDGKNYIPSSIKVSIGINNTVVWTNVDIASHTVVGDKEEFRSPLILPNQTWTFTFDKIGEYGYHGEPGPWLRGTVTVLPIDMNFDKGKPIENWGGEPFLGRYIFRDTDSLGYVNKVSVIDDNSVLVSLSYPNGTEKKKIELGEEFIGSCSKYNEFTTVRTFVLERIDNEQKNTQFREELEQINKNCNETFREN